MKIIAKIFVSAAIFGIAMFSSCNEEVTTDGKVTGLKIVIPPGKSTTITVGSTLVINGVVVTPENAAKKRVEVTCSNPDVVSFTPRVTVSGEQGTGWSATGISPGTADIIATATDDSGVTTSLTITVIEVPK